MTEILLEQLAVALAPPSIRHWSGGLFCDSITVIHLEHQNSRGDAGDAGRDSDVRPDAGKSPTSLKRCALRAGEYLKNIYYAALDAAHHDDELKVRRKRRATHVAYQRMASTERNWLRQ